MSQLSTPEKEAIPKAWLYFSSKQMFYRAFVHRKAGTEVCVANSMFLMVSCPCLCPPYIPQLSGTIYILSIYSLQIVQSKNIY